MLRTVCMKLEALNQYCLDSLHSFLDVREETSVVAQTFPSFLSNIIAFMRCEYYYEASSTDPLCQKRDHPRPGPSISALPSCALDLPPQFLQNFVHCLNAHLLPMSPSLPTMQTTGLSVLSHTNEEVPLRAIHAKTWW